MNNLADYYRELMSREGRPNVCLAARWPRNEINTIVQNLQDGFVRCHFEQEPLLVESNASRPAIGNRVAGYFALQLDQQLDEMQIQSCAGQGYPDRRLVHLPTKRSYVLELKAKQAFEPKSNLRLCLTCSSKKLRRHFVAPINHLLLTIFYKNEGRKIWIQSFRLDFLEPWTKVAVRLEASVSQHLLADGRHVSFSSLNDN